MSGPISGVLGMQGTPRSLAQRRLLAVFDAGSSAARSHLSAARMWGLQRRSEGTPHVVRFRDEAHRRRPHVGVVHSTRHLPAEHLVRVGGIPLTEPLGREARMLDKAWAVACSRSVNSPR